MCCTTSPRRPSPQSAGARCRSWNRVAPKCWPASTARASRSAPIRRSSRPPSTVVVVVGTPVDEHLNPDPEAVPRHDRGSCVDHLVDGQLLVLRSTVYPGVTALVDDCSRRLGRDIDVSLLSGAHRRGQGDRRADELPQIVSGRTNRAHERAAKLFGNLTQQIVHLEPEEAELAKLFTNTWRYIKFAVANQLFMIANDFGLDFERIRARAGAGLSRVPRICRGRVCRGSVPAQGHDAARRVQQQQLHARPRQHDGQRRPPAVRGRSGSSSSTTSRR